MTIIHDAFPPPVVISGVQDCRPAQTCSLEDSAPEADIWWVRSASYWNIFLIHLTYVVAESSPSVPTIYLYFVSFLPILF